MKKVPFWEILVQKLDFLACYNRQNETPFLRIKRYSFDFNKKVLFFTLNHVLKSWRDYKYHLHDTTIHTKGCNYFWRIENCGQKNIFLWWTCMGTYPPLPPSQIVKKFPLMFSEHEWEQIHPWWASVGTVFFPRMFTEHTWEFTPTVWFVGTHNGHLANYA